MKLTFNDVLITPQFSYIESRKHVDLFQPFGNFLLNLPIISANMDTVTGSDMANVMKENGGIGCLHRFQSIENNVEMYKNSHLDTICSFGLGNKERERVIALIEAGVKHFCLDVANGAQISVIEQTNWFKASYPKLFLIVGNFGSVNSLAGFLLRCEELPNAIKIGIGGGSACTTRIKTGIGYPQFSLIEEIRSYLDHDNIKIISDGGHKTSGDIAKALGAGADIVMLGGMLAGTDETPGDPMLSGHKIYRGSASKESYEAQGKDWSTAEGESFIINSKGPAKDILKDIEGGLKSSLSYTNSKNLKQFRENVKFIQVSNNTVLLNGAHGK